MPKVANKHGVVIAAQEKGCMDTEGMKLWIDKVWRARRGGLERRRSLLVFDLFEAHVTDRVKRALERENTNLAVIPGGLTSILQLLDVSLNKPFKDGVDGEWNSRIYCNRPPKEALGRTDLFVDCGRMA